MAKIEVKVLKQAGETGLRLPGACFLLDEITTAYLEGRGLVEIKKSVTSKQEKVKLETKEEKFVSKKKITKAKKK